MGQSVAFPDVCLCPPTPPAGPIPTPLPNTVMAPDLTGGARTVLIGGTPAGKRSSFFAKSTGNEVATSTGGGVVSHAVQGKAHFQTFSPTVFIEGEPAVRHLDLLTHNHLAQPGNTPPAPWMSTMSAPAAAGRAGPKKVVQKPETMEGKERISIEVVDDGGKPAATAFRLTTPAGQVIEDSLLWGGQAMFANLTKGKCRLELPRVDARCEKFGRRKPADVQGDDVAYPPGKPLQLEVGKHHRVVVPAFRSLWIEVPRPADAGLVKEQKFLLRSDDGVYELEQTGTEDELGDAHVFLLEFPGLFRGPRYTLTHQDAEGDPVAIFSDQPFESLFTDEPDEAAGLRPERGADTEPGDDGGR